MLKQGALRAPSQGLAWCNKDRTNDVIYRWKRQVSGFRVRQSEASLLQGFSSGSQLDFALNILWDSLLGFQAITEISKHL